MVETYFGETASLFSFFLSFIQQLEEKTRRLRELESASNLWEGRIRQLEKEKHELTNQVKQTREALDEHVARLSKEVTGIGVFYFKLISEKVKSDLHTP